MPYQHVDRHPHFQRRDVVLDQGWLDRGAGPGVFRCPACNDVLGECDAQGYLFARSELVRWGSDHLRVLPVYRRCPCGQPFRIPRGLPGVTARPLRRDTLRSAVGVLGELTYTIAYGISDCSLGTYWPGRRR